MKSHLSPSPPLPRTGCDPKPTPPLYTFGSPAADAPLRVRRPRAPPTPALLAGLGQRALLGPSPSLSPQQGHGQLEPCLQSHCAWIPARVPSTCPAHLQQQNQQQHWKKWQRGAGPGAHVRVGVHAGDRRSPPRASDPRSLPPQPGPPTALGALCPRNPHLLSLLLYLSRRAAGLSLKL